MHHNHATPNRRTFLSGTIQAAGAVLGAGAFAPLLAGEGSRGFKIGACDWSLRKHADPAAFDLAKRIGIDGIQAALGRTADDAHLLQPETRQKYLAAARRTGMEICSLAITALNAVPPPSNGWTAHNWKFVGVSGASGRGTSSRNSMVQAFALRLAR